MHKNRMVLFFIYVLIAFFSQVCLASDVSENRSRYPFYIGITAGYGATTWGALVPREMNDALNSSVPINVSEGGGVGGIYAGYEVIPAFAVEASFMRYPTAELYFDESSLFTYYNHCGDIATYTRSVSLIGKFLLTIPGTKLRAYSSAGAAEVHRQDMLVNRWRLSPTFGVGFNYNVTDRLMVELGTEYTAGYGQSELDPADHFIPFLYSAFLRVALRF